MAVYVGEGTEGEKWDKGGGEETKMDEAKTRRKWPKVGCSLTRLQSRTAGDRHGLEDIWSRGGEEPHTTPQPQTT